MPAQIVAKRVANKRLKDLLMRLANAMSSGEPETKFLEGEWITMMSIHKNEYERALESLKRWTDAYIALLVSMAFVVRDDAAVGHPVQPRRSLHHAHGDGVPDGAWWAASAVYIIRAEAPKEFKTHNLKFRSIEQKQVADMEKILIPGAAAACALCCSSWV